jgi:hypothetical protein
MWHKLWVTPRSAQLLVAVLLVVKLLLLVWNAALFDGRTSDFDYHADRALFGGLKPSNTAHDGPTYYLPALLVGKPSNLPRVLRATAGEEGEEGEVRDRAAPRPTTPERKLRSRLIEVLRYTNVGYLSLFYLVWLYVLFPRLTASSSAWLLASLLLLALPGYQRLAVMPHPQNLVVALFALTLAAWLSLRERFSPASAAEPDAGITPPRLVVFATAIGLLGSTRTFALVPAAVLTLVCAVYVARSVKGAWVKLAPRVLLLTAFVAVLGFGWHTYGRACTERTGLASYVPSFGRNSSGFDYLHYYTSFDRHLLARPDAGEENQERASGSFASLLYSEIWGDEWRSLLPAKSRDDKKWAKYALLNGALAVPLLGVWLLGRLLLGRARQLRAKAADLQPAGAFSRWRALAAEAEVELVLFALLLLGGAAFLVWQGGPGLLPGDNSTVKFTHVAELLPLAIALSFSREPPRSAVVPLAAYFFALNVLAFPVAMYWPR